MNKKIIIFSLTVLFLLMTSISIPVISEEEEDIILDRTHIRAIGINFHVCSEDGGVYGHIFIGFKGIRLVFNEDINIPKEDIIFITMTKHILNCIYRE